MLMDRDRCTLLIIDVQTKLLPVIHDGQIVLEHCVWLVRLASRMGVPVLGSEQYPKGVRIVSREMVAFEWLRVAGTELFKDVSKSLLR